MAPPPTPTRDSPRREGRPGSKTLGLTGGIGMGKSTVAAMFRDRGVPVHDADASVHALYARNGAAVEAVGAAFPGVVRGGAVDRAALSEAVVGRPEAMRRLEAIVHPLVREAERAFLARHADAPLVVLDVPLLFETGGEGRVDAVAVVSAPEAVRAARVLARPGMTRPKYDAILARQVPEAERLARADHVIDTSTSLEETREAVDALIARLRGDPAGPKRETTDGERD